MIDIDIIKIAARNNNHRLIKSSSHYASVTNKICGDKIKLQVELKKKKINLIKYETESCIFCQASASILSDIIKRLDITELKTDIANLQLIAKNKKVPIPYKYREYKALINEKYKNRINCVMLPFNALIKALKI